MSLYIIYVCNSINLSETNGLVTHSIFQSGSSALLNITIQATFIGKKIGSKLGQFSVTRA